MLEHRPPQQEYLAPDSAACFGVKLQCPHCNAAVDALQCFRCGFQMQVHHGLVSALPAERVLHFEKFVADYERIRAAEGRGSLTEEFYLALPYRDVSGRNSGQWKIRAKSYDYLIQRVLRPFPNGLILDLGAGNCWMSFRLALANYRPIAVDLLTNENDGMGAAKHFQRHLSAPILRFQAELRHLPFQDGQFDAIIFNASFHYSEDYEATLREALRCLKPQGAVIISDTPWYSKQESGERMVEERHAAFKRKFGTASDSVTSLEYLTDERLKHLEQSLSITWTIHRPWYGMKWAVRPVLAKLRGHREPSQFRIYVATKHA